MEEDVERDTSATLSIGGPVVYWLVVEPTVVLHQQFVERWFSGNRSGRVVEARRPVVLKTRVVLQNVPERLDCVPDRATRQIVGRRWRVSSAASGASDGLESVLERRLARDRRLAVEDDFECRRTFFCCVDLS